MCLCREVKLYGILFLYLLRERTCSNVIMRFTGFRDDNLSFNTRNHSIMKSIFVWYGSINYLSYGNAEESVMRIENAHIANELLKSISE